MERTGGAAITFDVQRIQSTEELERALSIDAEASYGSGSFGPKVSARFSYAKKQKVQSSSLFMLVSTRVDLAFLSIDDPVLSQDARGLVSNPAAFKARYGNMFVRGIGRGGLFVGTMRIETQSSEESRDIAAELKGSYGLFSADIKAKFSEMQKKYKSSTYIDMYHEGGPTNLKITDLTSPLQLLDNANLFLDSFNTEPDKVAWPYFVSLAPIVIAQGPLPPNSADLEHAQDVLVACSKARSCNLDKVNLLEYMLDNQSRFEFTGGADPNGLQKALDDFQADLELVADCASTALRSPEQAAFPAIHAKNIGLVYPKASLPALPVVKAAKLVAVPDLSGCKNWGECNAAVIGVGLVPEQVHASVEPGEAFKMLDVSPRAGTSVPEGSVVRIVTQPAKVVGIRLSRSSTTKLSSATSFPFGDRPRRHVERHASARRDPCLRSKQLRRSPPWMAATLARKPESARRLALSANAGEPPCRLAKRERPEQVQCDLVLCEHVHPPRTPRRLKCSHQRRNALAEQTAGSRREREDAMSVGIASEGTTEWRNKVSDILNVIHQNLVGNVILTRLTQHQKKVVIKPLDRARAIGNPPNRPSMDCSVAVFV